MQNFISEVASIFDLIFFFFFFNLVLSFHIVSNFNWYCCSLHVDLILQSQIPTNRAKNRATNRNTNRDSGLQIQLWTCHYGYKSIFRPVWCLERAVNPTYCTTGSPYATHHVLSQLLLNDNGASLQHRPAPIKRFRLVFLTRTQLRNSSSKAVVCSADQHLMRPHAIAVIMVGVDWLRLLSRGFNYHCTPQAE